MAKPAATRTLSAGREPHSTRQRLDKGPFLAVFEVGANDPSDCDHGQDVEGGARLRPRCVVVSQVRYLLGPLLQHLRRRCSSAYRSAARLGPVLGLPGTSRSHPSVAALPADCPLQAAMSTRGVCG